jgi:hypothetical protein
VRLEGTRDGRALGVADIFVGQGGAHPVQMPFVLPTGDPEKEDEPGANVFAPPKEARPGVHVWLADSAGHKTMGPIDRETCEQMQALGYMECAGR